MYTRHAAQSLSHHVFSAAFQLQSVLRLHLSLMCHQDRCFELEVCHGGVVDSALDSRVRLSAHCDS